MKFILTVFAAIFIFSCTDSTTIESDVSNTTFGITDNCEHLCSITFYPNDPESSILPCGELTMSFNDGYFIFCLEENVSIVEYLGWHPNSLDEYYNDFWSFIVRRNCVLFQPNDSSFYDLIKEEGFQLDLIVCTQTPQAPLEISSS